MLARTNKANPMSTNGLVRKGATLAKLSRLSMAFILSGHHCRGSISTRKWKAKTLLTPLLTLPTDSTRMRLKHAGFAIKEQSVTC